VESMKPDVKHAWLMLTLILASGGFTHVLGNDSAASTAIGGIQLRREANISMEKERLTISEANVTLEYEFLNQTNENITSVVAFPIPPNSIPFVDAGGPRGFNDFRLSVEGKELKYSTEVRAKLRGNDYTEMLKSVGINIASFADYDTDRETGKPTGQITKLSKGPHDKLLRLGLISGPGESFPESPSWDVVKTYYWAQTFPAHKVVHVRHEYTPSAGFELISPSDLDAKNLHANDPRDGIENSCIDPSLQKELTYKANEKYKHSEGPPLEFVWVDYILTTANSWKTPIKDFTLIVDRRRDSQYFPGTELQYVSLCWNRPIRKLDADHYVVHETNFVPKKEIHLAFISFLGEPDK
jgi:hypothetical protein